MPLSFLVRHSRVFLSVPLPYLLRLHCNSVVSPPRTLLWFWGVCVCSQNPQAPVLTLPPIDFPATLYCQSITCNALEMDFSRCVVALVVPNLEFVSLDLIYIFCSPSVLKRPSSLFSNVLQGRPSKNDEGPKEDKYLACTYYVEFRDILVLNMI